MNHLKQAKNEKSIIRHKKSIINEKINNQSIFLENNIKYKLSKLKKSQINNQYF
jgi:hypothetical protein